jgi:hypothetical protein
MTHAELIRWQQRLQAQPMVWTVHVHIDDADDGTGDVYDSREAAEFHAARMRSHGYRARVVCLGHIQNLELSRERWGTP